MKKVFFSKDAMCRVFALCAALFISVALTSCDKKNNEDDKILFVTQTTVSSDLRCGAFSLAYYKWIKEGKIVSSNATADYATVDAIYAQIKFGSLYSAVAITGMGTQDLSATSCPLNMLHHAVAELANTGAEIYRDATIPAMNDIYNAIGINNGDLLATYNAKVKTGGIPTLNVGQYAVVVFFVASPGEMSGSLHWVLFHRNSSGYQFIDPYFGTPMPATEAQMKGSATISVTYPVFGARILQSMNSCLLLP